MQPLDGMEAMRVFVPKVKYFKGYRASMLRHQERFLWHYRCDLGALHQMASTASILSLFSPSAISNPANVFRKKHPRTPISTTDRLDIVYQPVLRVDAAFVSYFKPTTITDSNGRLNEALADDVLDVRYQRHASARSAQADANQFTNT